MITKWQDILTLSNIAKREIKILKGDSSVGQKECEELNLPTNSALDMVIKNSNGIIIENWIRIWGQSNETNNGVLYYNKKFKDYIQGLILVASDVVGGLFAINIDRFDDQNLMWYFAPDTLDWECMEIKYVDFIEWCFQGRISVFYESMRWKNWDKDFNDINMNSSILIYPFLWAKECDINYATKKIVPADELIGLNFDYSQKFSGL